MSRCVHLLACLAFEYGGTVVPWFPEFAYQGKLNIRMSKGPIFSVLILRYVRIPSVRTSNHIENPDIKAYASISGHIFRIFNILFAYIDADRISESWMLMLRYPDIWKLGYYCCVSHSSQPLSRISCSSTGHYYVSQTHTPAKMYGRYERLTIQRLVPWSKGQSI